MEELNLLATVSNKNRELEGKFGRAAVASVREDQEAIRQALDSLEVIVRAGENLQQLMKSGHIAHAVEQLRIWGTSGNRTWDQLFNRVCNLRETFRIEFEEHMFFAYSKPKGQKFKDWEADWEKVHESFPVRVDSFSATDCYALGYNTASVFHSMRVAEVGLRAIAKERRTKLPKDKPIDWACWQEIIKALDNEIRVIGQTWKAGSRKDAALEFYSGARADLNGFKDEYRNLVMHVRVNYDEFQALRALTRVHDFMSRLAERIDEKSTRIKWGRP